MVSTFVIPITDALDLDEDGFREHGGTELRCSQIEDDGSVKVHVEGPREAIRFLADQIIEHHRHHGQSAA